MLTKQFINNIQTNLKQISADSYISPKFIYYETQTIIADFLKKDQDAKKKLSKIQDGWSSIECVDLEEVSTIECADIDVRLCEKMMKSIHPLPEMYSFSYGNIIDHVASPNFAFFFNPTTPRQWNSLQKRKYKDKSKYYFFILDNYLYLPIPKDVDLPIESLRIKAYFKDKSEVDKFKLLKDCGDCKEQPDLCKSPMDYDIVIPSYLLNDVETWVLNRIAGVYLKIQSDNYANMNPTDVNNQKDLNTYGTN